jgi:stearoyl-CoA desaturase (delta-9 desaturase)
MLKKIEGLNNQKYHWDTIAYVAIIHILAVIGLFYFSWTNLIVMLVGNWVAGSLGIGLGYHRLLTHRSFQTPKWLERVLAVCGTLALQSGPLQWVTTHRIHHAFTETDKDPHSPRNGVFWSHVGWIFFGTGQNHSELVKQRYSPDLMKDKFLVLLSDYYVVPTVISGVIMLAVGGWSMVLWGVFLRVVLGWHSTWLVNSMTHIWGTRRFETRDDSRNNVLIGLLAFGEGWHNNHHAHPTSARHGLAWYEFDLNWIQIRLLELAGLAKKVKAFDLATYNEKMELKRAA